MSLDEIEAELQNLGPEELRTLALKCWAAFVERQGHQAFPHECGEDDPRVLAALDEAIAHADSTPGQGHSPDEARARLKQSTSK